jgi:hypothetical protein
LNDHRALFERIADLMNRRDWEAFDALFTDDYVEEYPQSGEVIRGRQNALAVRQNYPGGVVGGGVDTSTAIVPSGAPSWGVSPRFTLIRIEGTPEVATAIFKSRYPDGSTWWLTTVYELRGGKIARATMLFAPEFDPPDWRKPYRELP